MTAIDTLIASVTGTDHFDNFAPNNQAPHLKQAARERTPAVAAQKPPAPTPPSPPPTTVLSTCQHCHEPFQALTFNGRVIEACCSHACVDAERVRLGWTDAPSPKNLAARWAALCPPRYAAFDADALPVAGQKVCDDVLHFDINEHPGRGLALTGPSATGKSMLIHEAARLAFYAGHQVMITTATEFAFQCANPSNEERRRYLQRCCRCDLLLLDDVGKWKLTEHTESYVYHVLEQRESWRRPVYWTANSKGEVLKRTMTEDRADPILNRLKRAAFVLAVG